MELFKNRGGANFCWLWVFCLFVGCNFVDMFSKKITLSKFGFVENVVGEGYQGIPEIPRNWATMYSNDSTVLNQQNYELQTSVSFRKGYFRESLLWITTICFQLIRHDDQSYTQNYHACICMFCEIKNIAHIALSFVFALKAVSLPDSCLIKKPSHGNPTLPPPLPPHKKNPKNFPYYQYW